MDGGLHAWREAAWLAALLHKAGHLCTAGTSLARRGDVLAGRRPTTGERVLALLTEQGGASPREPRPGPAPDLIATLAPLTVAVPGK